MVNSFHTTIKFTEEHSTEQVIFLDTVVKRRDSGLYTDLFVKGTATHSYLMYDSCHPPHCVRKGPYSQFCKLDEDFEGHASNMKQHYRARKYPDKIISEAYEKAKSQPHETLIHNDAKNNDDKDNLPFITNYHPNGPNVMKINTKKLAPFTPFGRMQAAIPQSPSARLQEKPKLERYPSKSEPNTKTHTQNTN